MPPFYPRWFRFVLCFAYAINETLSIFHLEKADFHLDSKMVKKLYSSGFRWRLDVSGFLWSCLPIRCTYQYF